MPTAVDRLAKRRFLAAFVLLFFCAAVSSVRAEAFTASDTTAWEKAAGDNKSASAGSGSRDAAAAEDKTDASASEPAAGSEAIDRIRALEEAVKSHAQDNRRAAANDSNAGGRRE